MSTPPASARFPASMRIKRPTDIRDAMRRGRRVHRGPLRVHIHDRAGAHHRLGLAVSRRVGNAIVRNRIKRMLREAFRQDSAQWTSPSDVLIIVHPHDALDLAAYRAHLNDAMQAAP